MDKIAAGDSTGAKNIANDLENIFNTGIDLDNIVTPEFI
jgi:hypothetical protein